MSGLADAVKAGALTGAVVASQMAVPVAEAAHLDPALSEAVVGLAEAGHDMAEAQATAERMRDEMASSEPPEDADYAHHGDPPESWPSEQSLDPDTSRDAADAYAQADGGDAYESADVVDAYESADVVDAYAEGPEAAESSRDAGEGTMQ